MICGHVNCAHIAPIKDVLSFDYFYIKNFGNFFLYEKNMNLHGEF